MKNGPAEICIGQQEGILGEFLEKNQLWFFNAVQFISLKLFFFSFSGFVRILIFNFNFSDSQFNYLVCEEEHVCMKQRKK